MEALGKYILSVTAAAILLGILRSLHGKKGSSTALIQLLGGLFLTFTMIAPMADVDLDAIFDSPWMFSADASVFAAEGQKISQEQLRSIIKERSEAYILDKASSYHAQLEVDVIVSQDAMPIPTAVYLRGSVSPYVKSEMEQWLQDDMGILKENQLWNG